MWYGNFLKKAVVETLNDAYNFQYHAYLHIYTHYKPFLVMCFITQKQTFIPINISVSFAGASSVTSSNNFIIAR